MTACRPATTGVLSAALLLLVLGTSVSCTDREEGRALRAPDSASRSAASVPASTTPAPDEPVPSLAECTDGNCTSDLGAGDRIDFEAGVGLHWIEVDEVDGTRISFSAEGEPGNRGIVCLGGCGVSIRGSSQSGSQVSIRAEADAVITLGDFRLKVLSVDGDSATVRLG